MSDPFNMENVAAMAGLPQQGHNSVPALPNTRREMTDTVRIMPRQPIEAKRDEFGEGYYVERGTSIIQRDYLNSGGVGWVEVSDPIVWDGTDAAFDAIEELLRPLGVTILLDGIDAHELDEPMPALQLRDIFSAFPTVGFIPPMGRIRAEGDSFAILPPEEVQS